MRQRKVELSWRVGELEFPVPVRHPIRLPVLGTTALVNTHAGRTFLKSEAGKQIIEPGRPGDRQMAAIWHRDPRLTPCADLLAVARIEDVAQITTFALDHEAAALTDLLGRAIGVDARVHAAGNVYWPGWTEITIQHRAAEKGAAIPALLKACSISDADVIACGDHLNDLGLFAAAAHSIAPANAHPTVLESATEIVGANDEDGIVRHLLDRHAAVQ